MVRTEVADPLLNPGNISTLEFSGMLRATQLMNIRPNQTKSDQIKQMENCHTQGDVVTANAYLIILISYLSGEITWKYMDILNDTFGPMKCHCRGTQKKTEENHDVAKWRKPTKNSGISKGKITASLMARLASSRPPMSSKRTWLGEGWGPQKSHGIAGAKMEISPATIWL